MGREGDSRGTTQVSRQAAGRFVLTNISLPNNAGIAVRTICRARYYLALRSHERLKRELQLISVECNSIAYLHISGGFCQPTFLCHCLYIFWLCRSKLLHSIFVTLIICENGTMSRLGFGFGC